MADVIYPNMRENYKLIEFILNNNLMNKGAINRKTLIKLTKSEKLSLEEKNELIRTFCALNYSLLDYDIELFENNIECILSSIKNNPNSVQELPSCCEVGYMDRILDSINEDYYITEDTPQYLRGIYKLALRSIEKNIFSVDYLNYDCLTEKERDNIVSIICSSNEYYINSETPDFLKNNRDVTDVSYKNNPDSTIEFCNKALLPNKFILDSLDKLPKNKWELSLDNLKDVAINKKIFSYSGKGKFDIEKYNDRVATLVSKVMSKPLTIENIHDFGRVVGYMDMRKTGETANPFSLIVSSLRSSNSYEDFCSDIKFILFDMEKMIRNRMDDFNNALKNYYDLYHGGSTYEEQNKYLSLISSICFLYYSKCIEEELESGFETVSGKLSDYFVLRKDNKAVKSYVMSKRYIRTIKKFYLSGNFDEFVSYLKEKYNDCDLVDELFESVCNTDRFKISGEPHGYKNYLLAKEANKLVNRLNSGYLKYTDKDIDKYVYCIGIENHNGKLIYKNNYESFLGDEEFHKYDERLYLANKIKREILLKAKEVNEDNEIYNFQLREIDEDCFRFNDDFYELDSIENESEYIRNLLNSTYSDPDYDVKHRLPFAINDILDDEKYNALTKFVSDNGAFYLFFFYSIGILDCFSHKELLSFGKAYDLLKEMGINELNYFNFITAFNIVTNCSKAHLVVLEDLDIIQKIIYADEYTCDEDSERIRIASELVAQMSIRNYSTVPYIKGSTGKYSYSLYDNQDPSILVCGIDTDACFRVSGNDNDFIHYCAINQNGFVLKITDNEGKFIARAAGLRHGNSIYFNQLRTIFDVSLNRSDYSDSQIAELREVMFKAAQDFINISKVTEPKDKQIENVFITQSYGFKTYDANVGKKLREKIGDLTFIEETDDFKEFNDTTENIYSDSLDTDYKDNYSAICLASQNEPDNKGIYDGNILKNYDAEAYYKRTRSKVIYSKNPSKDLIQKINRIRAINSLLDDDNEYMEYIPDINDYLAVGDGWYIIAGKDNVDMLSVLYDDDAQNELESVLKDFIKEVNEGGIFENVYTRRQN